MYVNVYSDGTLCAESNEYSLFASSLGYESIDSQAPSLRPQKSALSFLLVDSTSTGKWPEYHTNVYLIYISLSTPSIGMVSWQHILIQGTTWLPSEHKKNHWQIESRCFFLVIYPSTHQSRPNSTTRNTKHSIWLVARHALPCIIW